MKEHVIINLDRTVNVPESMKKIGIQYDHNVKTITFDCPRYPDENQSLDMSAMKIFINWMLPDKTLGSTIATNVCVDSENENLMHFDWVITRVVTSVSGVLSTLICIKETTEAGEETYHWNSELIQSFKVGNGMECTEQIAEQNIDVITQLLVRMDAVDARTSTEAIQGYVDTSVNTYLNQNPITPTDEQATTGINTYMNNHAQGCVNNYLTEHPISPTEEQMKQGVAANSEMFQSSVDDYLGRNPLQLDNGLTETTKAAPANKVGEIQSDVTDLKSDLANKLPKSPTEWESWTADEQAVARERIGIPGDYELIEEITLTDEVSEIIRDTDTLGNKYSMKNLLLFVSAGATTLKMSFRIYINNKFIIDTENIGDVTYAYKYFCKFNINNGCLDTFMGGNRGSDANRIYIISSIIGMANFIDTIKSVRLQINNPIEGATIKIYGVRA